MRLAFGSALLAVALFGCGGGPTGPTEGTLEVITSTTGSDLDTDGYSLTVDEGAAKPLAPNGADTVASLSDGNHTVTLAEDSHRSCSSVPERRGSD
jgi:hypothetical protein